MSGRQANPPLEAPAHRRPAHRWPALRWPAEWEPHAATWLAWPHNPDTWPGRLAAVEQAFATMVAALADCERVSILTGGDEQEERMWAALRTAGVEGGAAVAAVRIPTDDAWLRDTGPLLVFDDEERVAVDFRFDSWGGKYAPWLRDDAVGAAIAERTGSTLRRSELVLEGGSIDGDGGGTLLTTEQCLLHPNRNRGAGVPRSRETLEAALAELLGAKQVAWLQAGIEGDDTDGHVDDVARFVAPGTVVAAVEPDPSDPNHQPLAANRNQLRGLRDASGRSLSVVEIPMPPPLFHCGTRLPASYANFYLANQVALVPVFGVASDQRALAILQECLDGRRVVPIPSADLVIGLGSVHCLALQEPAPGLRG